MEFIPYTEIQTRASLGVVKDYSKSIFNRYHEPKVDYQILLDMMRADPVIATAFDVTVDVTTSNGYSFVSKDNEERLDEIKETKKFFDDVLDFDRVLRNALYQYLIYGDVFLELRKLNKTIAEIHPLESSEMAINYDQHGRITEFVQRAFGVSQDKFPSWSPDEILYIRAKWIGSQVYSYSPMEPIGKDYTTNIYAKDYLNKIFLNMPPKYLFGLMGASAKNRETFIENLQQAKTNPMIDLVVNADAKGKIIVEKLLPPFADSGLMEVLGWLRKQILMITRVPPILVGEVGGDGANRSNSEAQIYSFMTKIKGIHKNFESHINKDLMEKLGHKDLMFKFNNVTEKTEESIVTTATQLFNMGASGKDLVIFLKERGIPLPKDLELEGKSEQAEQMFQGGMGGAGGSIGQDDTAPSRRRENTATQGIKSKLNQQGTSKAGELKTKEKDMKTRASKFLQYPYTS